MTNGITEKAIDAGRTILQAVPPSFLGLCLVNFLFLATTLWFLQSQVEARMMLVTKIVEACVIKEHKP